MKNKKFNKNILYIILIVALIILLVILYLNKGHNSESSEVKRLYEFLGSNDLQVCGGLKTYGDEEINQDNLPLEDKLCLAYSLAENTELKVEKEKNANVCNVVGSNGFAPDNYDADVCTISMIEKDKIDAKYKEVYGEEISEYKEFNYNDITVCYYKEDEGYYCGLSEGYTTTIGAEPHTYRSIVDVKKNSDELVITDYFLKTVNSKCYNSFTENKENEKCSNNLKDKVNYKFLKKYGKKYRHTFKKDGNNYFWIKSEPLN